MASITMTASFLGGATLSGRSSATTHRRLVVTKSVNKASCEGERVKVRDDSKKESNNNGRRDLMFAAAAAAAVCSAAGIAVAGEPKPGSPEAKKFYAPVCVTMPTARVCRK
ncbi:photosystem II 5 kDa protein, chloroplastic-like [Cornus florida]|uniref:photosystem II 5 kDa protein, chloroplastic-like n=1 Tax=Cornus florida TaxID=4283 RepID=UPI00289E87A9|nr:photosystem II 5 kDa protein, chloroplastic-like [Cornus florida]